MSVVRAFGVWSRWQVLLRQTTVPVELGVGTGQEGDSPPVNGTPMCAAARGPYGAGLHHRSPSEGP